MTDEIYEIRLFDEKFDSPDCRMQSGDERIQSLRMFMYDKKFSRIRLVLLEHQLRKCPVILWSFCDQVVLRQPYDKLSYKDTYIKNSWKQK